MKNVLKAKAIRKIAGIIALVAVIGFSFTACGDASGGGGGGGGTKVPDTTSATYTANDGAYTYTMVITKASGKAVYQPKEGDAYVMTINPGNIKSSGTVKSIDNGKFTLASGNGNKEFTVTFSENTITNIEGEIPRDDGEKFEAPVRKSVTITGINNWTYGTQNWERAGVWLFTDVDTYGYPINIAIQSDSIKNNALSSLNLVTPVDNTWNMGMSWAGKGDYYVALVPIYDGSYYPNYGRIFTNGGNSPVKVSINEPLTTLDFSKFNSAKSVSITGIDTAQHSLFKTKGELIWVVQAGTAITDNNAWGSGPAYGGLSPDNMATQSANILTMALFSSEYGSLWVGTGNYDLWLYEGNDTRTAAAIWKASSISISEAYTTVTWDKFTKVK
jgi:hypothetical protein